VLRRRVWSRNIKNGCSIYIYDISRLSVNGVYRDNYAFHLFLFSLSSLHKHSTWWGVYKLWSSSLCSFLQYPVTSPSPFPSLFWQNTPIRILSWEQLRAFFTQSRKPSEEYKQYQLGCTRVEVTTTKVSLAPIFFFNMLSLLAEINANLATAQTPKTRFASFPLSHLDTNSTAKFLVWPAYAGKTPVTSAASWFYSDPHR